MKALQMKREGKVKFVWTKGNKVLVRRKVNEDAIRILINDELYNLGWREDEEASDDDKDEDEDSSLEEGNHEIHNGEKSQKIEKKTTSKKNQNNQPASTVFTRMMTAKYPTKTTNEPKTANSNKTKKRNN